MVGDNDDSDVGLCHFASPHVAEEYTGTPRTR
jgi:hypothetical protein